MKYGVTGALPINFHFSLICTLVPTLVKKKQKNENQRIKLPLYFMNKPSAQEKKLHIA